MNYIFRAEQYVGDIIMRLPGSVHLFMEKGIDFCCGGQRTLRHVLEEKNLDEERFLKRLHLIYEDTHDDDQWIDWDEKNIAWTVDYIVDKHHQYLVDEVPALMFHVNKVKNTHIQNHPELEQVLQVCNQFQISLSRHSLKEEEQVFPIMKRLENNEQISSNDLQFLTQELSDEHEQTGEALLQLRILTNDYELPEDACGNYELMLQKFVALESDLMVHVHLENNVLFPKVQAVIG